MYVEPQILRPDAADGCFSTKNQGGVAQSARAEVS